MSAGGSCAALGLDALGLPPFFQVGFVVEDLDAAMAEMGRALGVSWMPPRERRFGRWSIRVSISRGGRFELVESLAGSPWSGTGSRMDHLAFWVDDLAATQMRLERLGCPMVIDGADFGGRWSYHAAPATGMRLELVDAAWRPVYEGFNA